MDQQQQQSTNSIHYHNNNNNNPQNINNSNNIQQQQQQQPLLKQSQSSTSSHSSGMQRSLATSGLSALAAPTTSIDSTSVSSTTASSSTTPTSSSQQSSSKNNLLRKPVSFERTHTAPSSSRLGFSPKDRKVSGASSMATTTSNNNNNNDENENEHDNYTPPSPSTSSRDIPPRIQLETSSSPSPPPAHSYPHPHPPPAPSISKPSISSFSAHEQHSYPQPSSFSSQPMSPSDPAQVTETDKVFWSHDQAGRRMVNQYARIKELGRGQHGRVWLCEDTSAITSTESGDDDITATASATSQDGCAKPRYLAIKSVNREDRRTRSLRRSQQQHQQQYYRPQRAAAIAGRSETGDNDPTRKTTIPVDDKVMQEIAIMKRCQHKHIVRLIEVIDDARSKKIFMVLEYMAGGQVDWQDEATNTPKMTVDVSRKVFRDVVLGLEYLHYQGVIHRDIKPANLLWETSEHQNVKISDFGVSHLSEALSRASSVARQNLSSNSAVLQEDDQALRKTAGSPAFFAPELCFPAEYTPLATPQRERSDDYFSSRLSSSAEYNNATSPIETPTSASTARIPQRRSLHLHTISPPLPAHKARERPTIGSGIDVWALGVTLYCLLFGRTPFHARTEYELYNIIPWKEITIPETMGSDRKPTGSGLFPPLGSVAEDDADPSTDSYFPPSAASSLDPAEYEEGKEVIDLLSRLLEKDSKKRITLAEVKKHPWVLRKLDGADEWLQETDPTRNDMVAQKVTREDVQQATASRFHTPVAGLRASIRRAIQKIGIGGSGESSNTNKNNQDDNDNSIRDSRRKSASSASYSANGSRASSAAPSRQPSRGTSGNSFFHGRISSVPASSATPFRSDFNVPTTGRRPSLVPYTTSADPTPTTLSADPSLTNSPQELSKPFPIPFKMSSADAELESKKERGGNLRKMLNRLKVGSRSRGASVSSAASSTSHDYPPEQQQQQQQQNPSQQRQQQVEFVEKEQVSWTQNQPQSQQQQQQQQAHVQLQPPVQLQQQQPSQLQPQSAAEPVGYRTYDSEEDDSSEDYNDMIDPYDEDERHRDATSIESLSDVEDCGMYASTFSNRGDRPPTVGLADNVPLAWNVGHGWHIQEESQPLQQNDRQSSSSSDGHNTRQSPLSPTESLKDDIVAYERPIPSTDSTTNPSSTVTLTNTGGFADADMKRFMFGSGDSDDEDEEEEKMIEVKPRKRKTTTKQSRSSSPAFSPKASTS